MFLYNQAPVHISQSADNNIYRSKGKTSQYCYSTARTNEKQCMLDTGQHVVITDNHETLHMRPMSTEENIAQAPRNNQDWDSRYKNPDFHQLNLQLSSVQNCIKRLENKIDTRTSPSSSHLPTPGPAVSSIHEWRYLAMVMDRFFFVLYLILIIVSLSVLFPRTQ